MQTEAVNGTSASLGRLMEMLTDRFGAFEAIAVPSIKLARHVLFGRYTMAKELLAIVVDNNPATMVKRLDHESMLTLTGALLDCPFTP
jgi:hypothetical protein